MRRPTVRFTSALVHEVTADTVVLNVQGTARNPNGFPVLFEVTEPRLTLAGTEVSATSSSVCPDFGWLPARSVTAFQVPLSLRPDALRTAHDAANPNQDVPFRLEGYVQFWDYGTPVAGNLAGVRFPFHHTATLKPPADPPYGPRAGRGHGENRKETATSSASDPP
jgi:hypothetical protein